MKNYLIRVFASAVIRRLVLIAFAFGSYWIFNPDANAASTFPASGASYKFQRLTEFNCNGTWSPISDLQSIPDSRHLVPRAGQTCAGYTVLGFNRCSDYNSETGSGSNCSDNPLWVRIPDNGACPANSTFSGNPGYSSSPSALSVTCTANPGYTAVPDVSGGWEVQPTASCSGDQFYQSEINKCTYFPCDGSTPYMQPDGSGGYTCEPLPATAGCYDGDNQWLNVGGTAGSNLPGTVTANGCTYRPMTCAEAAALEGLSASNCPAGSDPFSKVSCVDDSCGGWYVGTGEGAFVDDDTQPPMTGTPGGSGNPGGGGDNGTPGSGGDSGGAQGPGNGDGSGIGDNGTGGDSNGDGESDMTDTNDLLDQISDKLSSGTRDINVTDGKLYEKSDRTVKTVFNGFIDDAQDAPFFNAASNFFTISINSGNCPVWETTIEPYSGAEVEIKLDQLCSPIMQSIFPLIRAILMATAGFIAFRWAFL